MKIAVIDGQGGGIGKAIIEKLIKVVDDNIEIICIGTNSMATMAMLKAGAKSGATGENAVKIMSQKVDIITGPMAICVPNSMMGEISESIANSIGSSNASKVVLTLKKCGIKVAGVGNRKINELIDDLVNLILTEINNNEC